MYAPGVEDRSGEILAAGISSFGKSIAGGLDYQAAKQDEEKDNFEYLKGVQSAYDNDPTGMMTKAFGPDFDAAAVGVKGVHGMMQGVQMRGDMLEQALVLAEKQRAQRNKQGMKNAELAFMKKDQLPPEFAGKTLPEYAMFFGVDDPAIVNDSVKMMKEGMRGSAGYRKVDLGGGRSVVQDSITGEAVPESSIVDSNKAKPSQQDLRKEYSGLDETKAFRTVSAAYSKIKGTASTPVDKYTAADDIALIFSFMKIVDPGSTVREGEFANAESTRGVPDAIRAQYNKILKGERLSPEQRQNFVKSAAGQYRGQLSTLVPRIEQFKMLSEKNGYDPSDILTAADLSTLEEFNKTAATGPGSGKLTKAEADKLPVLTVEEAKAAAPGTIFKTTDGRIVTKK